jgi:hypothetical protein
MEFAERRDYVERRRDGELQWIRELPRRERRTSGAWVRESRQRRSHAVADDEVIEIAPDRVLQENRLQQNLPSFPDVERLLGLYVATGEGRGAYLAAKKEEEKGWAHEGRHGDHAEAIRRRQRHSSRPHGPPLFSSVSSDDHSDDEDDGLGGRPPHRPPSGGPTGRPPEVYIVQPDGRHRPAVRRDNRAWIPLQVIEDGERRFLRAEEYDPNRQGEYRPYYPGAAYFNDQPRPIRRSRPSHVTLEHSVESVVSLTSGVPAGPAAHHPEVIIVQGPQGGQHHVDPRMEAHGVRPPPAYPEVLHLREDYRPPRHQEAHRPPRPTVEDALEDEDDPRFASLPSEEDDVRIRHPSRHQSPEVRNRSVRMDRTHSVRMNRTRSARMDRTRHVIIRGGDGANHNFDENSDEDVHQLVRMRGGGAEKPLSKTSSIGAGVVQKEDYSTSSKFIV